MGNIVRDAKLRLLGTKWLYKYLYRSEEYLQKKIDDFKVKYRIPDDDFMSVMVAIALLQDDEYKRQTEKKELKDNPKTNNVGDSVAPS